MASYSRMHRSIDRRVAVGLILLLLLAVLPAAAPREAQAEEFPATVRWDPEPEIVVRNNIKSVFPWGAVDSKGNLHVVFTTGHTENSNELLYTNNISGAFRPPQTIERNLAGNAENYYALAIGPGDVLHLAYTRVGADGKAYYRIGGIQGDGVNWSDRIEISGAKSFAANLAVDRFNNAHIVWIDKRENDTYHVFYRVRYADGRLSPTSRPKSGSAYQNLPQIAVTDDGKAHVVFLQVQDLYYARLEPGGWVNQRLAGSKARNPALTTDGTALYVAWDWTRGDNHDIAFMRSVDGGLNWSNTIFFSETPQWASFPHAAWSETAQRVYVAWSDETKENKEIWFREFDPVTGRTTEADRMTHLAKDSLEPVVATNANRVEVVWEDRVIGDWQIYHWRGTLADTACDGRLTLDNGAALASDGDVSASIELLNCAGPPDSMQVSVDFPITDATPKQPFQSQFNVTIPPADACDRTVYVRLFKGDKAGNVFGSTIRVDLGVKAHVNAVNPFLIGNEPAYNNPSAPAGAFGGDPKYSRSGEAYLSVINAGDCAGLELVEMAWNEPQALNGNVYASYVSLGLDVAPGEGPKTFQVFVTDALSKTAPFPSTSETFVIVYDKTPPVLDTKDYSPSIDPVPSADSIIVPLTFRDFYVTDNLYGEIENYAAGKQLWGVWLAVVPASADTGPDNANLNWYAVPVPRPDNNYSFTIRTSLLSGLDYDGAITDQAGDYVVYARALDGAGMPSAQVVSTTVTLEEGYSVPTVFGSMVVSK